MEKIFDDIDIEIDEVKLRRMKAKIYALERMNYRTNRHSIPKMIEKIREIIIEEYKRNV